MSSGDLGLYEKVPSLLFEYTVSSSKEEALVTPRLVLMAAGFKENEISESFENKLWSLRVFTEHKNQIDLLNRSFKKLHLPGIKIGSKSLRPKQWLTKWKSDWKPLSLTQRIDVVPFWHKGRYKTTKEVIYLDTLMSFGTGMHETTQLIAQMIEDNSQALGSFLDIGTGTGILTLVALKLGGQDLTAMDISPLSIEATKNNLKVNGQRAKVILGDIGRLSFKRTYQMVAANLVTEELLRVRHKLEALVRPGGILMVSGISLDNLKKLKDGFKDLHLTCRKVCKGKQWAAILYVKKMS